VDQSGNVVYRRAGLGSAGLIFSMPTESVYVYWDASSLEQAGGAEDSRTAPLVAEVLGMQIHTADPEEMKHVILRRLLDRYATEQGIVVNQAEINEYRAAMRQVAEQDRQRRAERRKELVRQLAFAHWDDVECDALELQLQTLDQLEADLGVAVSSAREERTASEEVAAAFIRQWKVNRAVWRADHFSAGRAGATGRLPGVSPGAAKAGRIQGTGQVCGAGILEILCH